MGMYTDDWAILVALCLGVPGTIVLCERSVPNGSGKDLWTYFLDLAALKLSLLLFYLRMFTSTTMNRLLWATVVFDVIYGIVFALVALLQCRPISYFWLNWDREHQGTCINTNAVGWANAGISIAMDFWMLALPLSQLKGLRLHWRKKIGVALMFFVGTFVTIVSILRLHALVDFANSDNPTFDNFDVMLWSTTEINVGLICACMPALRQILARIWPNVFGGEQSRQRYYRYGNGNDVGNVPTIGSKEIVPVKKGMTEWWQGISLSRASMFASQRVSPNVARILRESSLAPTQEFQRKGVQVHGSIQVEDDLPTSVPMQNLTPYVPSRPPRNDIKSSLVA
ncbi:CFEM domain-containing protein [Diaporthe helianthi]|uniref:CFEM domain-containing protein n=1 Tax=Diaporthe helianthi TaxID=158607 RepID=A0A2P5I4A2_DIAHE|nr:CFEM domain-containing protein [Diaporthe helianthi]